MTYDSAALRDLFASPFDAASWTGVLADLFGVRHDPKADLASRLRPLAPTASGDKGFHLGSFTTSDGYLVGLFRFEISSGSVLRRKVGLRALVKPFLGLDYDAALVVFADRGSPVWRFSFVCDIKGEATAPKRFTYVFGDPATPHRTPVERFLALQDSREPQRPVSFEAMQTAFSVEALSDQFFKEYKEHYEDFVSHVTGKRFVKQAGKWVETVVGRPHRTLYATFGRNDKRVRDYVKKLLGRLVFLHFLQKKGWLGASAGTWADGDRAFLLHLFEKSSPEQKDDFLDGVLERLFFNALNTDRTSQDDFFVTGVSGVGKCRIPYLNGGLFERDDLDNLRVKFPAEFFERLLKFFAEYNFTIDENDPDEAEVGIDPEMLGRIFENLLEDNKDKGAFYTPKEIVGYMCRRSLLAYLSEGHPEKEAAVIEAFLDTRDPAPLPPVLARDLDDRLRDVKICDPAIGSGAFPMGLLRELFALRLALASHNQPPSGRGVARSAGGSPPCAVSAPAALKREIIENNVYGVDIEKGAVDIARLRFWLSLVVDEEEPSPLPNLDFKIMQGNSLIESWKGHNLAKLASPTKSNNKKINLPGFDKPLQLTLFSDVDDIVSKHRNNLRDLLRKWYSCADHRERIDLRRNIRSVAEDQIKSFFTDFSFGDIDLSANTEFFLCHVWFAEVFDQGGFDILIGNPPYIQLQADHGKLGDLYKPCGFETFAKTGDIYCLFYERGWQLLKDGGHLCYITSNKWMRAGYGEPLRKFLAEKTNPEILVDFAGEKIFESATVDTNILLFQKGVKNEGKTLSVVGSPECRKDLSGFVRQRGFECSFPPSDSWVILSPIEQSIKRKIEAVGTPLKDWDVSINYGIKTGCNEAFIVDEERRAEILSWCKTPAERRKTDELIRPILRGRDIKRYGYDWAHLYLIATHNGIPEKGIPRIDVKDYPAIKRHLDQYWDKISVRADMGDTPYNLRSCAYMDDFSKPKIVWGNLCLHSSFAMAPAGMFANAPSPMIVPYSNFVLAVLNSKLGDWYIRQLGVTRNGGYFEYKPMFVEQLPVPHLSETEQSKWLRNLPPDSALNDVQEQIDELVFALYGLSKAERDFILAGWSIGV